MKLNTNHKIFTSLLRTVPKETKAITSKQFTLQISCTSFSRIYIYMYILQLTIYPLFFFSFFLPFLESNRFASVHHFREFSTMYTYTHIHRIIYSAGSESKWIREENHMNIEEASTRASVWASGVANKLYAYIYDIYLTNIYDVCIYRLFIVTRFTVF